MKEFKSVDVLEFTEEDKKTITHAAYAQCLFILGQAVVFPSLGVTGAIIAGVCGMMPWLIKFAKESLVKAFCLVLASLCTAPVYGKLCEFGVNTIQELWPPVWDSISSLPLG